MNNEQLKTRSVELKRSALFEKFKAQSQYSNLRFDVKQIFVYVLFNKLKLFTRTHTFTNTLI